MPAWIERAGQILALADRYDAPLYSVPLFPILLFAAGVPCLGAARCGAGDGSGGAVVVLTLGSPDARCVALADTAGFPPDFDFVPEPGEPSEPERVLRVFAGTATRSNLIPIEIELGKIQMTMSIYQVHGHIVRLIKDLQ